MTKSGCFISLLNYLMAFIDLRVNADFLSVNIWWALHHPVFCIALFLITLLSSFKSNYISFLNLNASYILFNLSQMLFLVVIIFPFYLQRKHIFFLWTYFMLQFHHIYHGSQSYLMNNFIHTCTHHAYKFIPTLCLFCRFKTLRFLLYNTTLVISIQWGCRIWIWLIWVHLPIQKLTNFDWKRLYFHLIHFLFFLNTSSWSGS